ncbi:transposase [Streptomyces sp. NPDC059496]|uniref:transposase n=1 Tax=Streptomyces sp. NPDC059496 TaxID=3346851 RepID=UPI0036C56C1D
MSTGGGRPPCGRVSAGADIRRPLAGCPRYGRTPHAARRKACRIPDTEHHRPKWELALEMLDELAGAGLRPAALVADTGYGANAGFRHGLEDRGLAYVLQVKGEMTAHGGLGPRPLPRYRTRPVSLREHVLAAGAGRGGGP